MAQPERLPQGALGDRPTLKLYEGPPLAASHGGGLSAEITLTEFLTRYVEPIYLVAGGSTRANRAQYAESAGLWARYTGDPPLAAIDGETSAGFVTRLQTRESRGRPISPNTVRKHRGVIRKILDLAGPKTRGNPQGAGLLADWAYLPCPRRRSGLPEDGWTLDEIALWLDICPSARFPKIAGISPAAFWYTLILFVYNTGLRLKTAVAVRWDMIRDGWLVIPPEIIKGGCKGQKIWLSGPARRAIEPIRTADPRIIPWPWKLNRFHAVARDLIGRSEIPPDRLEQCNRRVYALRKALLTHLASVNFAVAKIVAGHTSGDVTLKHYVHPRIVKRVLERVPQPVPTPDDPQLRLF